MLAVALGCSAAAEAAACLERLPSLPTQRSPAHFPGDKKNRFGGAERRVFAAGTLPTQNHVGKERATDFT